MTKKFLRYLSILVIFMPGLLFAQNSWKDDFNSGTIGNGWFGNANYSLSQQNGQLVVNTAKAAMWASFGVNIPNLDIHNHPNLNFSIQNKQPILLSVWLVSGDKNIVQTIPVMASDGFHLVNFDFEGMDAEGGVLDSVKTVLIGINGNALSWKGTIVIDDLMVGDDAVKKANVPGMQNLSLYAGSKGDSLFLRGINHASSLELSGAGSLLENVSFSPISQSGTSWMRFDCVNGATGELTATLTAMGEDGFADNALNFQLSVQSNMAPSFDSLPAILTAVNQDVNILLKNINDGDPNAEQALTISAISSNSAVINNPITVNYEAGSPHASLHFKPLSAGNTTLTVTADDQQAANNTFSRTVNVEVLNGWNNPPAMDPVKPVSIMNNTGQQEIVLTGINDGDGGTQNLQFQLTASDSSLFSEFILVNGQATRLRFTPDPEKSGFSLITIKLTDDGGNADNNGNQSIIRTFTIETYNPPMKGYIIPFTGDQPNAYASPQTGQRDYWHIEGLGTDQIVSYEKDGTEDVMRIDCNNKFTWTGAWYYTPDMDLTEFPLLSMWVKCDQQIRFHLYFWDDSIRNNEDHHIEYTIPANQWTKVDFDFSDARGMLNGAGEKVNAKRIQRVLFNYHPNYNWPFTNWTGTVRFKDIRIGDKSGITPTYNCTIDPVGPRTNFVSSVSEMIRLTGLGTGKDKRALVAVSGKGIITNLSVTPVVDGNATINYTPSGAGFDTILITVSGSPIDGRLPVPKNVQVPITVVDSSTATAVQLQVIFNETHQLYRGLGAKDPSPGLLDLYTNDFGASAIRFGILDDNQVEPINDNNDPCVLDRSKLNYNAIDWAFVRNLKARGVESFLVTLWSPPAWMKENLSTNYQQPAATWWQSVDNKVMPEYYQEYAEDVIAIVKMFREEAGVDLLGIGLQNEPAFCEPYGSAILDPVHFAQMIALVGQRFEAEGITTKLYAAEQVGVKMSDGPIYTNQDYLSAIDANAEAKKYSDVFAVHGYGPDGVQPGATPGSSDWTNTYAAVNANGKERELWMTETEPPYVGWNDAFVNAANILTSFESGNVGLWTEWAWDGHCVNQGAPTQKLWAQSMFRFIKPGAHRLTSHSGNNDLLMTSWKNDASHGDNLVMVLMNKGNQPIVVKLDQTDLPLDYTVYRCSENQARFRDKNYQRGKKIIIGPRSILTLVEGLLVSPTIDPVPDQLNMIDAGNLQVDLTGITDGNETNQDPISINWSLSDYTIIGNVSLNYSSPDNTAHFNYTPVKNGVTVVTLNLAANGVSLQTQFTIEVKGYSKPNINPVESPLNFEKGTGTKTVLLSGINDGGDGGQSLILTAEITSSIPEGVLGNLQLDYSSPDPEGAISFTPDQIGDALLRLSLMDSGPDSVNSTEMYIAIHIYDHFPPTMAQQNDTTIKLGVNASVQLRGVTNGGDNDNLSSLTAVSSDETVTGVVTTLLSQKKIYFKPLKAGNATITVTLKDNGSDGKNTCVMTFMVTIIDPNTGFAAVPNGSILLYPNPVKEMLFIQVPSNQYQHYRIVDSKGSVMKEGFIKGITEELSTKDLLPGQYILILTGKNSKTTRNFIRE